MPTIYEVQRRYFLQLKQAGFKAIPSKIVRFWVVSTRFSYALHDFNIIKMQNEIDRELDALEGKVDALKSIKADLNRIKTS